MANTIKFGNTKWATKKNSILAFNDENANFKPLPFTTSRASTATRVNKESLIETVGVDVPRVDYLNNPKGAYLLEPQSTNLITQSEAFGSSYWTKSGATVTSGFSAPSVDSPLGAFKMVSGSGGGNIIARPSLVSNTANTNSIYLKRVSGNGNVSLFNTAGDEVVVTLTTEWKRFSVANSTNPSNAYAGVRLYGSGDEVLLFGAQTEQQSFATSYIPTSGGTQTRLEDDFTATLPTVSAFNSNNGFTFFGTFESSGGSGASSMMLQFNNNSGYIGFGHNGITWRTRINNGAANITDITNIPLLTKSSLSIAISPTDYSIFANGAQQTSGLLDLSGSTIVNSIGFRSGVEFGAVRISDLRMYNTKLTDAELTTLTTI